MADMDAHRIRLIMDHLIDTGYLAVTDDEYPVVYMTAKSQELFGKEKTLTMKLPREVKRAPSRSREEFGWETGYGERAAGADSRAVAGTGERAAGAAAGYGATAGGAGYGVTARYGGASAGYLDEGLFAKLKELRTRLAQEAHVPPYIIFSDASLRDMCRKRPENREQFLRVSGVGAVKLEKYGEMFIALIAES
jgi:ATP-dependent DNA helicase RecQ